MANSFNCSLFLCCFVLLYPIGDTAPRREDLARMNVMDNTPVTGQRSKRQWDPAKLLEFFNSNAIGPASGILTIVSFIMGETKPSIAEELAKQFKSIEDGLKEIKNDIKKVENTVKLGTVQNQYFQDQKNIDNTVAAVQKYFQFGYGKTGDTHDRLFNDVIEKGKLIEDSITNLINGLNGGEGFGADIMIAYRDALNMHEQNFHNSMIDLNRILTAAWGAYGVYANLRSVSEEERSDFINKANESEKKMLRRWNKALLECRNEGKVSEEMMGLMRDNSEKNNEETANLIFNFLTDKYSSRAWFVMVYNDISGSEKHTISGNLHYTSSAGGKNAVAYSVNKNFLEAIIPYFISLRDLLKTDSRFQSGGTASAKVAFDLLSKIKEYEFAVVSRGNGLEGTWTHGLDIVFENTDQFTVVALPITEKDKETAIQVSFLSPLDEASLILNKPFWQPAGNKVINWQEGSNGQVMYSEYCDFYGHDIGREPSKAEDCGDICVSKPDCNHFTYQKTDSYCYLKSGKDIPAQSSETSLCGWVKQRKGDGNNNDNGNKIEWKEGSNGRVMWSEYCDFHGHDIDRQESKAEDCGDICVSKPGCNHFTYQKADSFCYLKSGKNIPAQSSETALCGWVI